MLSLIRLSYFKCIFNQDLRNNLNHKFQSNLRCNFNSQSSINNLDWLKLKFNLYLSSILPSTVTTVIIMSGQKSKNNWEEMGQVVPRYRRLYRRKWYMSTVSLSSMHCTIVFRPMDP